jgi:pimeloyl-ACP methyl ester carboxylesterase
MKASTGRRLFLFSGLGADERVFSFLRLKMDESCIHHIRWIKPSHPNEALEDYATRLIDKYNISSEGDHDAPLLLGVSFGGIVAQEVAKQLPYSRTCLLSSLSCSTDLPFWYRLNSYLNLHHWLPLEQMKRFHFLAAPLFGIQSAQEKEIFKNIALDTDIEFARWAVDRILLWNQPERLTSILQLHGDSDLILPYCSNLESHTIKGGTHLMVMSKAETISSFLNDHFLSSHDIHESKE